MARPLRRHRAIAQKAWIIPATGLLKMAKRENRLQSIARKRPFSPWHWRRVKKARASGGGREREL